ncbi:MAG TPA: Hpt domain-containing protein [Gemmatimonadaceae bacterium]|nr:Hpt domain-containing protein [Gemmatimonadaceae bacterium]
MSVGQFEERLAKVRHRFAGTLRSRVDDALSSFCKLTQDVPGAPENVDEAYRRIHSICGVASTVGFPSAGKSAREAEVALLAPMRAKRGLTRAESAVLKKALDALRRAAQAELQIMYERGG